MPNKQFPEQQRPLVMGVVNVTPDSFSDGGNWLDPAAAIDHGTQLLAEGADLLDVGGESTRPGATRPLVTEELSRVLPVIAALAETGACVSVDTMRAEVAAAAVAAGAKLVNDVSGGLADPEMFACVAELNVPYVLMHWRGHADVMNHQAIYQHPVAEVAAELSSRVAAAITDGISPENIIIDPGVGFAKTYAHNWEILANLAEIAPGFPLLIGASRKAFLGELLQNAAGEPRPVAEREAAHLALLTGFAQQNIWGVRTHQARAARDVFAVVARLKQYER